MRKTVPIIVDGPNFVNRVLDLRINKQFLVNQLTLDGLRQLVKHYLESLGILSPCEIVEFVCSKKSFGSGSNKFTTEERNHMINHFRKEMGVYVEEVDIPGSSEKGVDMMVAEKIREYLDGSDEGVLVSADRDYIPLIKRMRGKSKKVIVVALSQDYPIEIENESYAKIDVSKHFEYLFNYSYPYYDIDTLTLEQFKDMIANTDDTHDNQLRVEEDGLVYFSKDYVGAEKIYGLRFRWETFDAYNDYVGPRAASDEEYVSESYQKLKKDWESGRRGYLDY